jgi:hypothetical protein
MGRFQKYPQKSPIDPFSPHALNSMGDKKWPIWQLTAYQFQRFKVRL